MSKAEFLLRTMTARDDAEIYVLLADRRRIRIEDLAGVAPRVSVLRPVCPLTKAAP